ncbi:uncharacterized protein SCODWIG_00288 [Saccharomycodes ludwigii]|uniref:RRM domain-containing protein n=1 Tax=Saccharomycodes ludwigii TaxID=36035 RepID=A0A376B1I0_9ASCO|nr:hypothetical protein SCDLUD_002151 [Saccharomycodes ludwigii]KAH3902331.1 hypothetical protein SCDLUD_002151 [Saccharomycodes ludwigii]SSD58527.1 uncharacterized protein SCODWIG_00288 [Saccharomycodes ludwigii]
MSIYQTSLEHEFNNTSTATAGTMKTRKSKLETLHTLVKDRPFRGSWLFEENSCSYDRHKFKKFAKNYLWGSRNRELDQQHDTQQQDLETGIMNENFFKKNTSLPINATKVIENHIYSSSQEHLDDIASDFEVNVPAYAYKTKESKDKEKTMQTTTAGNILAKKLEESELEICPQLEPYTSDSNYISHGTNVNDSEEFLRAKLKYSPKIEFIPGTEYQDFQNEQKFLRTRRGLVFKNLPKNTGIISILNQIRVGPIEKIVKINEANNTNEIKLLEIHFMEHNDAEKFYKYIQTGQFLVNGICLTATWIQPNINTISNQAFALIHDKVYPENEKCYSQHGGSTFGTGARRCLILKKHAIRKPKSLANHYPSPLSNYSPLNVSEIFNDFSIFGDIVDITPVVSRKLCICINFFDVRSAIQAKASYEQVSSKLYRKYYREWTMWYGKDIADRACLQV